MIAPHDFERKVNDLVTYLERGDVVKVSKLLHGIAMLTTKTKGRIGYFFSKYQINDC